MSARTSTISPAMEDYLKAIHQIAEDTGGGPVQTQALSDRLQVSTASVTGMMKKLDQYNLVEHEPYRGVVLTPRGEQVALEVLRHHRLLELYLVEQLGMSWEEVHAEAFRDDVFETVGLGQPDRDPHGDPIPARDGTVPSDPWQRLTAVAAGSAVEILRVSDRDPRLLQYLAERGLRPGATVSVESVDELAGVITLSVDGTTSTLALTTVTEISVRV